MTKWIFVAGAGKDAGKTALCLGLAGAFAARVEGGASRRQSGRGIFGFLKRLFRRG